VGGTRQRHFDGTSLKPGKVLENAQSPRRRVHALLGALTEHKMTEARPNEDLKIAFRELNL
jgi:hypothetical protein